MVEKLVSRIKFLFGALSQDENQEVKVAAERRKGLDVDSRGLFQPPAIAERKVRAALMWWWTVEIQDRPSGLFIKFTILATLIFISLFEYIK